MVAGARPLLTGRASCQEEGSSTCLAAAECALGEIRLPPRETWDNLPPDQFADTEIASGSAIAR